jgi:hypothetical protein
MAFSLFFRALLGISLGFMLGGTIYQGNLQMGELILNTMALGSKIEEAYYAIQALSSFTTVAPDLVVNIVPPLDQKLAEAYTLLYNDLLPALGYDFLSQFDEIGLILFYIKAIHYNIDISLESFLINADTQLNAIHFFYTGYGVSVFKSWIKISIFDSIQTCHSIMDFIPGMVRSKGKENIIGYKELHPF